MTKPIFTTTDLINLHGERAGVVQEHAESVLLHLALFHSDDEALHYLGAYYEAVRAQRTAYDAAIDHGHTQACAIRQHMNMTNDCICK